jgi:ketopantoate hydroxymethyltransferase
MGAALTDAFTHYMADVQSGAFPTAENSFEMDESELEGLEDVT